MSYPGSKSQAGTWQRIIGQMPPHALYVEAFAGSAQIYFRKRPAAHSLLIDLAPSVIARLNARIRSAAAGAGDVAICGDAISILPTLNLPADAVVYCDPPYLLSTRQGRFYYDHEMTDADHCRLLAMLQGLPARVLLSGYPSALYAETLAGWRCLAYRARTRHRTLTECLWCNFPEPTELHDWRYAGLNFRQRLSLKRLAARWLARLERMPPLKRGYVLNAIAQRPAGPNAEPGAAVPNARSAAAGLPISPKPVRGPGQAKPVFG